MASVETGLEQAERRVREAQARVTQQEANVDRLLRNGHCGAAAVAFEMLRTHQQMLTLTHRCVEIERICLNAGVLWQAPRQLGRRD